MSDLMTMASASRPQLRSVVSATVISADVVRRSATATSDSPLTEVTDLSADGGRADISVTVTE